MVSEHDVPQSLLPLPTAVPVSPDDVLYDTNEHFDRRTSLPVGNTYRYRSALSSCCTCTYT